MQCTKCGHLETKVTDSRLTENNKVIRRRRECDHCNTRFTTFERMEMTNFLVVKKDGTREPYSREKIEKGIVSACHKRPVSQEQIAKFMSDLEEAWSGKKEIAVQEIGEAVMDGLKHLDHIAYIRFASVYREFHDIDEFKDAISSLGKVVQQTV